MSFAEEQYKTGTSLLLPFEKMHGLGNDFVIVNASHLPTNEATSLQEAHSDWERNLTKRVCDRHRGIGADGLIVIDAVKESENSIRSWRYYNSDGSIGEMCGNGIRCAAKYIYEHGLSAEETFFKIETLAGDISVELLEDELVRVGMGAPREIRAGLSLETKIKFDYDFVSMGNPHAIAFYNDFDTAALEQISQNGSDIEVHSDFPNRTNVEFARVINPQHIELIVWERGCGFTQACGTGACATVVSAILRGYCSKDEDITVSLPGGDLIIKWDSVSSEIYMTGKSEMSFLGYYNDEQVRAASVSQQASA